MSAPRIMVDQIIRWPSARPPFDKGSCHLTIEGDDLEPLHAFAARLGLRREWFQPHPKMPHYDLTPRRRAVALRLGAVFVEARQQAIARRARKDQHELDRFGDLLRRVAAAEAAGVPRSEAADAIYPDVYEEAADAPKRP